METLSTFLDPWRTNHCSSVLPTPTPSWCWALATWILAVDAGRAGGSWVPEGLDDDDHTLLFSYDHNQMMEQKNSETYFTNFEGTAPHTYLWSRCLKAVKGTRVRVMLGEYFSRSWRSGVTGECRRRKVRWRRLELWTLSGRSRAEARSDAGYSLLVNITITECTIQMTGGWRRTIIFPQPPPISPVDYICCRKPRPVTT